MQYLAHPWEFNAISDRAIGECVDFVPIRRLAANNLTDSGFVHGGQASMPAPIVTIYFLESLRFPDSMSGRKYNDTPRCIHAGNLNAWIATHVSATKRNISARGENTRARSLYVHKSLPTRHFAQSGVRRSLIKLLPLLRESVSFNTPLVFVKSINGRLAIPWALRFVLIPENQPV